MKMAENGQKIEKRSKNRSNRAKTGDFKFARGTTIPNKYVPLFMDSFLGSESLTPKMAQKRGGP